MIKATLTRKLPVQTINLKDGSTMTKQTAVFEWSETAKDGSQFPKLLAIEWIGKNVQRLATANEGDDVEVGFDVSSRAYERDGDTRYFTSVRGYYIKKLDDMPTQSPEKEDDGLPF